jgi:hypothetical protein
MNTANLLKIESMIYLIRGHKVMLDSDLALLYGVETKALKRAVKRNINRFPEDFMFEMSKAELEDWRRQFGTSNKEKMGLRIPPFVFTELGVAMLSSVLNSAHAIEVNISIMRIFFQLRSFLLMEEKLNKRMDQIESGINKVFKVIFQRLDDIEEATPALKPTRKKIGLRQKG